MNVQLPWLPLSLSRGESGVVCCCGTGGEGGGGATVAPEREREEVGEGILSLRNIWS